MSSTVRHTPLQSPDADRIETSRNSHGAGVKILDYDGLVDALSDTLASQMDTREYVDRDDYPGKEWELLLGFTTWGRESDTDRPGSEADYHNVSNTGTKDLVDTWETVSEYTDPFVVYMTTFEGSWPHVAELDADHGNDSFYRVEACDGDVELVELTPGIQSRDTVER
ncbi:hypothetical protein [Salinibaculum rarum]|uniref:hypothetical protein n=1 Tax=Salinibaculum rarum TaxID=3058903 RepID=UPI00265DAD26|nr:hypothetical protein [Salinibaculum sp. KK48]